MATVHAPVTAAPAVVPIARSSCAAGLAVLLLLGQAPAQSTGYGECFDSPGINGRVWGAGTWNGQLFAGGPFAFQTGGGRPQHLARFDGRDWQDVGGGLSGPVRAIASYQGELIVAGAFASAGSVAAASIARWNGARWAPLGPGLATTHGSAEVFALTVFQGELYAGGSFDTAGGQPIDTLARWDGSQWRPVGGGLGGPPTRKVLSFASDGATLYVGGEFTGAGGQPARNVAAWDGSAWRALGSGVGSTSTDGVHALAVFQGQVFAGGNFVLAGGTPTRKIARWNGSAWLPLGLGIPDSSISVQVNALQVFGQNLYVCGSFSEVDAAAKGTGIFAQGVARWNGNAWSAVGGGGLFRNAFGGQVYGIAATVHDGRLIVAGEFDHAGPISDHAGNVVTEDVVAWDGTRFHAVGDGVGLGDGAAKTLAWNGSLWAVGGNLYAGEVVSPMLARFDGARWHTVGPLAASSRVEDAVVFQGQLHVAGTLRFPGGPTLGGLTRFDGSTWSHLSTSSGSVLAVHAGELYTGGIGSLRRWTGSDWSSLPQIFGQVETMLSFGGRLYVGGSSLRTATSGTVNLLVWDGASLAPAGGSVDGTVTVLHEHQGELWVGGWFTSAGSVHSPRLVRFDGRTFLPFAGTIAGAWVRGLATLGGNLYVAGHLGGIGGTNTTLARWNGLQLAALGAGTDAPATHLLADEATGTLWITGGFTRADTVTAHGIVTWHTRPRWRDLGQALPGSRIGPGLEAFGELVAPATVMFVASGLDAGAPAVLVLGSRAVNLPMLGGVLVPQPDVVVGIIADLAGRSVLPVPAPAWLPGGFTLYAQAWSIEFATSRIVATNAIAGVR
jgi:hypothetical protein